MAVEGEVLAEDDAIDELYRTKKVGREREWLQLKENQ